MGIARLPNTCCDVGTVLLVTALDTGRYLVVRKAHRPQFEANHQFAFPGGLLRKPSDELEAWVRRTVAARARAEVGCSVSELLTLKRADAFPPIVARYTARGSMRWTVILPLLGTVGHEFEPKCVDDSVYGPEWRHVGRLWDEITPTNGLILATVIWQGLGTDERVQVREAVADAYASACADAASVELPLPVAPWAGV